MDHCCPHMPINVCITNLGESTTSKSLGVELSDHPWEYLVSYVFLPALVALVLSKFLGEHISGQIRILILIAPSWMEASWLPTVLNMLEDIPYWIPIVKDLFRDVLVCWMLKGLPLM